MALFKLEIEFPDEHTAFMLELLHELQYVRILPPATEAEVAKRQRFEELRQRLYDSYEKNPLASKTSDNS